MSSLTALTQSQRAELAHVKSIHLVEIDLGALVLRWASRDFVYRYGSTRLHYASYLLGISGLGEQSAFQQTFNPKVTLLVANERWGNYSYLSRLDEDLEFQRSIVTIYETLLVDETEVFADADAGRTVRWKGVVERLYDIDPRRRTFKLDCCSRLFSLRNRIGLSRVSATQFPNADKSHVGQWRNLPIGTIEYLPCKLVKTGATDRLFTELPSSGSISSIVVSGTSRIPWASSGTLQIDSERFTYSSYSASSKTFSGISRAQGGTKAAAHSKGATVYQVVTEFIYEASCIPIDAITDVHVDGLRQSIGSGVQVYTGRPGLSGYSGTAVVRFAAKPVVEKQYNPDVKVAEEHGHTTNQGSHGHTFSGASSVIREGIGEYVGGRIENADAWRDGSSATATRIVSSPNYPYEAMLGCILNNSANLGPITGIKVVIDMSVDVTRGTPNTYLEITYGQSQVKRWDGSTGASVGRTTYSWIVSSSAGWGAQLTFRTNRSGVDDAAQAYIYSAHVEIMCTPRIADGPASGVMASKSGATQVTSETVAEAVIGREVTVSLRGVTDDPACTRGLPAGSITGTPGAVIRRPDHVFKYILCGLMGIPLTDIGASFASAGAYYAQAGYKLDFVVHDIGTDAQRLLQELASQCRSILYEWGGKFELAVLPNFDQGVCDFIIEPSDVVDGPVFSCQPLADTANRIMIMYRKDYRTFKEAGPEVQGPIKAEAADAGFMDYLEDGWGPRDLDETVRLTAIRESTPAQDYLRWHVLRKKLPEVTVSMTCTWREILLRPGMVFRYEDPVHGARSYLVTNYQQDIQARQVRIEGLLLPPWTADDCVAHACADTVDLVQTHLLTAQKCVAQAVADPIHALTVIQAQNAAAQAYADTAAVVQTHILAADECAAQAVADHAPLGVAWQLDAQEDLQPADYAGVIGWWEDDAPDLMPRNTVDGADNFWSTDSAGDLMPAAA